MPTDRELDRCAGVLVGLAAGDALGAADELGPPPSGDVSMKGGGLGGWKPGEWTDDTQMAICIAEETATGTVSPVAVAARFLEWYRSGPADIGSQTDWVLSHSANADDMAARAADYFRSHPDASAGNGSLMRTAPLALAGLGDDERLVGLATTVSALTHADPVAGEACALWCVAIDRAIRHESLYGVRGGIEFLPADRRSYWEDRLEEARLGPAVPLLPQRVRRHCVPSIPGGDLAHADPTDGDLVWTSKGQYAPGSTDATQVSTSYDLYSGQSVTVAGDEL
jgi:ADP-ribosylglycohydrolase